MSLGLLVMTATTIAKSGKSIQRIVEEVKQTIPTIHLLALLDTLKYVALGGRIGKAKALLGTILSVKPMLTIKNGELEPVGQVRTRARGIDRLFDFVKNASDIQDLAIVYNTTPEDAQILAKRIDFVLPKQRLRLAKLGSALGVHIGPGNLFAVYRRKI